MSNHATSSDEAKNNNNVVVKTEPIDEEENVESTEIKDYAETTMNELLGWYGYDKVGSQETKGLNLHRFTSPPSPSPASASSTSPNPSPSHSNANYNSSGRTWDPGAMVVVASDTHEEDSSTTPNSRVVCSWCQKLGMRLFTLRTTTGVKAFCSEICFTQCRRASFKKYKVCDWCKHIRHTVNYVDFQDGEQQLQFCSDKCLNQYKMNIFCRETQAHLQLHPHLQENDGKSGKGTNATLITPDLWLGDCSGVGMNGARNARDTDDDLLDEESLPPNDRPLSPPVQPSLPVRPASKDTSLSLPRHSPKVRVREKRRRHHYHLRPHNYYHARRSTPVPHPDRNGTQQANGMRPQATPVTPPTPPIRRLGPNPSMTFSGTSPRLPRFPPAVPPLAGVPPITVMVPYPIIVPVPVPIPIPIPIPIPLDVQQIYAGRRGSESASGSAASGCRAARSSDVAASSAGATMLLSPTDSLELEEDDDDNDGDCEESDVEVSRKLRRREESQQKRHRPR